LRILTIARRRECGTSSGKGRMCFAGPSTIDDSVCAGRAMAGQDWRSPPQAMDFDDRPLIAVNELHVFLFITY
jgi:hypothetical protein